MGFPLRQLTNKLRQENPAAEQLRIRRALNKDGQRIYQLVGVLPDGKRVARKLNATNELDALDAARELLQELLSKGTHVGRIPPVGATATHEAIALRRLGERQIRPATRAHKADYIKRVTDWLTMRSLPLTQATLLACIEDCELGSRSHRATLEATHALAKAAGIDLALPDRLRYRDPIPKRREVISDEEIEHFLVHDLQALPPRWAWLYRVVGCTGVRANGVLSMELPQAPIHPGITVSYWDSKRQRRAKCTPTLDLWEQLELSARPESLELYWMPSDRPADDLAIARANSTIQEATAALRRCLGTDYSRRFSFRQLRHAAGARMLLAGMDPMHVCELLSTSIEQLNANYSGMMKSHAASVAGQLFRKG